MMKLKFLFTALACLVLYTNALAHITLPDSIGIENQSGVKIILHKVAPKETYFAIGRRYKINPKLIIEFNKNVKLTPGQIIRVPTTIPFLTPDNLIQKVVSEQKTSAQAITTQYKVSAGETLYSIAKRFNTTVDAVVAENNLKSTSLVPGQILLFHSDAPAAPRAATTITEKTHGIALYHSPVTPPQSANNRQTPVFEGKPEVSAAVSTTKVKTDSINIARSDSNDISGHHLSANKFGLYEKNEKGVAVWMNNDSLDPNKKLILHRTAPVGTVMKITNPMTNRTTFAKVVGRFTENENTKDVILVMTKNVAEALGALDKRFHVVINYGAPTE